MRNVQWWDARGERHGVSRSKSSLGRKKTKDLWCMVDRYMMINIKAWVSGRKQIDLHCTSEVTVIFVLDLHPERLAQRVVGEPTPEMAERNV